MKNKFLNLLMAIALCCFGVQNAFADVTNPAAAGTYVCNDDGTVTMTVEVTYTTSTVEWLDCVQFTFPAGWTFVSADGGSASGWDQGSAGNVANFGNDAMCPTFSGVMYGSWGGSPNSFTFTMQPPAGFSSGVCEDADDGDTVPFTWTYLGDGYGEAAPSAPGNATGGLTSQTDLTDAGGFVPPPPCYAGDIIAGFDTLSVCPGEAFTFDVINDTLTSGGYNVFFADTYQGNGVTQTGAGGIAGGFNLTGVGSLPYTGTESLNGLIGPGSPNSQFDVLSGVWYLCGVALDEGGNPCSVTETCVAVTFLPAQSFDCQAGPVVCDANPDAPTSAPVCGGTGTPYSIDFGAGCALDSDIAVGNQSGFSIFYETDGAGIVDAGANGTVYTTGQEVLDNLGSGAAGETTFFGAFGDCSGVDAAITFTNPDTAPFTIDVYIVPVEASGDGTIVAIDGDCAVTVTTVTVNPDAPLVVTTAGTCDTDGTAVIGYDLDDDGATGAPDGDLGDAGDIIISTLTASADDLSPYPCDGAGSSETATLTAAELEAALGVAAGSGCYTDVSVTADCPSEACPPCDVTPAVLGGGNETCADGSVGPASLTEDVAGTGGITEYVITDADGSVTGTADVIISVGSFQEAQDAIVALNAGESICVTAMTYDQPGLDGIVADLNTCTGGLAGTLLGLPDTGNTFEIIFEAIVDFSDPDNPGLTIASVEALIGGGGGGPGLGGEADLSALLPGLACPVAPFCYRLSNTVCVVVGADSCAIDGCTDPCATNYNPDATVDDGSCTLPEEPATACYETATFNTATCMWDVTGEQPMEPATECYETATFNDATCVWDVTGEQPMEPATACYETATFNDATCVWDVTGEQPMEPATECYETATFNDATCVWDVTGEQPMEPATACYETATFNDATCVWDVTGEQPMEPATECYETATFNDATCVWDVTGEQPMEPATECYETATFNDATCVWDVTGTQPPIDDGCEFTDDSFDDATCMAVNVSNCPAGTSLNTVDCECVTDVVPGCTDPCATNYDPAANQDDGSCTLPEEPATACYETATFNTATCMWDVTGEQPAEPATACYETATFNDATCVWDVTGEQPMEPATECYETATFNDATCVWDVSGTQPPIDDGCDVTDDSFDDATCMAVNTPNCPAGTTYDAANCECTTDIVSGCTDPCATNYDPAANQDDGSCMLPAEPATECYETATFNTATCVWDVTGEQPAEPATACYETATFNDATCAWDVSGTQPPIDDGCDVTDDSFDDATCMAVNTPNCPAGTMYNAANCECVADAVPGCTDAAACNYDAAATADDGSCILPGDACDDGDAGTENDTVQADCSCAGTAIPVPGCTDAAACNYDAAATADDGSCILPGDACDDGDADTENDTVQADCSCEGTPIMMGVPGCTDAAACNYDPAATIDDGTCVLPGDSCNDGNPLTMNDTVQADCSCAGMDSGEPIPTVGEWGLIILALILLNLGVLYIRQTEIQIVSE